MTLTLRKERSLIDFSEVIGVVKLDLSKGTSSCR